MTARLTLDGVDYDPQALSDAGRAHLAGLQHTTERLQELTNMRALLTKAKNAYVAELKSEMLRAKGGFDFGAD
jgi:hypothetical protein